MINKVSLSPVGVKNQAVSKSGVTMPVSKQAVPVTFEGSKVAAQKLASSYQALNGIGLAQSVNFKGVSGESSAMSQLEQSIIGQKEIRIPNVLTLAEDINIPRKKMPHGSEHLNAAGLSVIKETKGNYDVYSITNDKQDVIFVGKVKKGAKDLPVVTYKQGKYMPEVTVKHSSLNGKSVKMFAGSELIGEDFKFAMPGSFEARPGKDRKEISFSGRTVITTLNKEPRTINAVDSYMESGLQKETIKGDYYRVVEKNDPTIIIPAGGFGERFFNITRENENKPSAKLPTDDRYRIIGTTLNLAASAGILNGDENDDVRYLSQNHEIAEDDDKVSYVSKYKTDGGAIAEGLKRDIIRNDRDSIILNADIFTNADISRTYNALKTLPNAALVIPYYPVDPQRAKSFGLLGTAQDEDGNLMIKNFIEKPKYTSDAPMPNDFAVPGDYDKAMEEFRRVQTATDPNDENVFFANPGLYFLSKEAAKVLMAKGILEPDSTGLGAHVMPKIVELANSGQLLDKDGNPMKVYTVPLEAKGGKPAVWDDIGTAEAYLRLIKDVAQEVEKYGTTEDNKYYGMPEFVLNDFAKNTDLETGIVFDSPAARDSLESFKEAKNITKIRGNIFVAG